MGYNWHQWCVFLGGVLCLLPGSVGHLLNQPQEIRTMGRWVGSHVFILLPDCVLPLSVWLLCTFHFWSDSHVSIPLLPYHFSHSSCDGSIWGYRKRLHSGGEYYIIVLLFINWFECTALLSAGQAGAECGHHESLSGQTPEGSSWYCRHIITSSHRVSISSLSLPSSWWTARVCGSSLGNSSTTMLWRFQCHISMAHELGPVPPWYSPDLYCSICLSMRTASAMSW